MEGRHEEALKEDQRKRDLDPLWPGSFGAGAQIYYFARRYEIPPGDAQQIPAVTPAP